MISKKVTLINALLVIGIVMVIVAIGIVVVDPTGQFKRPCENYADYPLRIIPARCLKYFQQ